MNREWLRPEVEVEVEVEVEGELEVEGDPSGGQDLHLLTVVRSQDQ